MHHYPEGWADWIAFFEAQLPSPLDRIDAADGTITYTAGDPREVVVRLTRSSIVVSEFALRWDHEATPLVRPRTVGTVRWRRIPPTRAISVVQLLIAAARETRRARFRTCDVCETSHPPEWMEDDATCVACANHEVGSSVH